MRQLIDLGALPGEEAGLGIPEVRRSRLLHSWAAAGLSVETILALVDRGALSLVFLDTPVVVSEETARRSDHHDLHFAPRGVVDLKGVAEPLPLYQALRRL